MLLGSRGSGARTWCSVLEQVGFGAPLEQTGLKSGSEGAKKQFYNPETNMEIATCPGMNWVGNEYLGSEYITN